MSLFRRLCLVLASLAVPIGSALAATDGKVSRDVNPDTGLTGWYWVGGGISLELIQRLPDQSRAFFAARGFPREAAERVARDCVFQTVLGNAHAEGRPVEVDLRRWRVLPHGGEARAPIVEGEWDALWQREGLPEAARIAFRWATFPTVQVFEDEDYNWGMTTFGLAPGDTFDLELAWTLDGAPRTARIANMQCAPDVERLLEESP